MRSELSLQLQQYVRINEDVKAILEESAKIKLLALNASVAARRVGHMGRGFVQVATELHYFSRETQETMTELRSVSFRSVGAVAARLREARIRSLLAKIGRIRPDSLVHSSRRELRLTLEKVRRLARRGQNLASLANVEASEAGQYVRELRAIADQFNQSMEEIRVRIQSLERTSEGL